MKIPILLLLASCLFDLPLTAQTNLDGPTRSVRGRVTSTTGRPLAGAIVTIASQSKGVPTNKDGFYLLSAIPNGATLVFMSAGYKTLMLPVPNEQKLMNQQVLNAMLESERIELPPMAATAAYRAIKLNKNMPPVATLPEAATMTGTLVNEEAYFPTGNVGLMYYVAHNLRYPAQAKLAKVEGDVLVEFTVTPNGRVDLVKLDKSLNPACDQEALRLVKQMPKWVPAKQMGRAIATIYVLPVRFTLE